MSGVKPTLIADRVRSDFMELGLADMPATNRAEDKAAWELAMAHDLERTAKARKTAAVRAAVMLKIIPDTNATQYPPGTSESVYDGTWVQVILKVSQPSTSIDIVAFERALREHKVRQSVIDECKAAAQKTNKAPHVLTPLFRSSRGEVASK